MFFAASALGPLAAFLRALSSLFLPLLTFVVAHFIFVCFVLLASSTDEGTEEAAIAAYWVNDGIDRCRVGFLPRHCIKHSHLFEGKLVQVVEMLSQSKNKTARSKSNKNMGIALAAMISNMNEDVTIALNELEE